MIKLIFYFKKLLAFYLFVLNFPNGVRHFLGILHFYIKKKEHSGFFPTHPCLLDWYLTMNSMKRQKGMTLKDELPRLVCAQYATGEECRNKHRKSEETYVKQKQYPVCGCN